MRRVDRDINKHHKSHNSTRASSRFRLLEAHLQTCAHAAQRLAASTDGGILPPEASAASASDAPACRLRGSSQPTSGKKPSSERCVSNKRFLLDGKPVHPVLLRQPRSSVALYGSTGTVKASNFAPQLHTSSFRKACYR